MMRRRRDAHRPLHIRSGALVALLAGLALAAGCSRAPKPRAEVPADSSHAGRGSTAARRPTVPATKPAPGTAQAGTRDGVPVAGATGGSSTAPSSVVPELSTAEQERLERETKAAMEPARKALDAVDATKLDAERNRKYLIAKDFLVQAHEALARREYERAQGLAVKAKLLAEEIAAR